MIPSFKQKRYAKSLPLQLGFFFGAFWSALYEALFGYRLVSLKVARNEGLEESAPDNLTIR